MDGLREDPRFEAILQRIHLPALPVAKARAHVPAS